MSSLFIGTYWIEPVIEGYALTIQLGDWLEPVIEGHALTIHSDIGLNQL